MTSTLEQLGYTSHFQENFAALERPHLQPGRIVEAYSERYTVRTANATYQADMSGNLRHALDERSDLPNVGDWVAMDTLDDNYAVIHYLLPRVSALCRRSVSRRTETQVIGANIDVALIMQAVTHDFNLNRLERYIAAAHSGDIRPVVLLSKTDLIDSDTLAGQVAAIGERHPRQEVLTLSSLTSVGLDRLEARIEAGKTYCLLGSSGVGKSTLINTLVHEDVLETRETSDWKQRGKHTTTHRALFVLRSGAIFIDTPGMRELGLAEGDAGLEKTFDDLYALADTCRFSDCQHRDEPGCAVQAALQSGTLDAGKFENFLKMKREVARFQSSAAEKRKTAKRQGKLYKRIQTEKHQRRY